MLCQTALWDCLGPLCDLENHALSTTRESIALHGDLPIPSFRSLRLDFQRRVNKKEVMYGKTRVDVKVERGPFNFYVYRDLPYIASILFSRVRRVNNSQKWKYLLLQRSRNYNTDEATVYNKALSTVRMCVEWLHFRGKL